MLAQNSVFAALGKHEEDRQNQKKQQVFSLPKSTTNHTINLQDIRRVNASGMDFHVGLVHFNWVLKNEMHVFNTLKSTIETVQKKEPEKKCIMLDVGRIIFFSFISGIFTSLNFKA